MKLLLHPSTDSQLEGVIAAVSGGYIFHGATSMGKALAAREVARRLNCEGDGSGECQACRRLRAGTYPDFIVVRPEDKPSITIDQIRALVKQLSLSPYHSSSVRMVIVDDAQMLTVEAQNALLKLIEEPPAATHFILVAHQPEALLSTVRSRLGSIYFAPVTVPALAAWLEVAHGLAPAKALHLAAAAGGIPGTAVSMVLEASVGDGREELDSMARALLTMGRFERLQAAKRLVDTKVDLISIGGRLQRLLVEELVAGRVGAADSVSRLSALEQFRRHVSANVSARVALERLMLEL